MNACLHIPSVPFIIATDLQDIVVFTPAQTGDSGAGTYERVKTTEFSLALRVVTAAYLDQELPAGVFLNCPDVDKESIQIWFFPKAPNKIPVLRLYIQMRLSLPPVNGILTLTFRHWFGIVNEHCSSSAGTSTYSPINQKLLFIPMAYLML